MKSFYSLLFVCFISISSLTQAQTEKKVNDSFNVGKSGSLSIRNSFGDIKIEPFSGDKIEVEVTILVETKNASDTQKYLDKIRIDVSETGNNVSLKTINEINGGNKVRKFSIDYNVKVPMETSLVMRNSFGDLYIEGTAGHLDIDVQHGDAYIGKASYKGSMPHELYLQFGDLKVEEIHNAEIRVQHGDFIIEHLNGGEIDLSFGDGNIESLSGRVRMDIQHSEIDVDEILRELEDLNVELQFSEFKASGFGNANYEIDMEGSFSDFDFHGDYTVKSKDKGMNTESYLVFTGQEQNTKKVRIRGSHSDVNLE